MSTTVNLRHPEIVALNTAVAAAFGCRPAQVCSVADTPAKKMAVFILVHYQGYKPCDIAGPYSVNCLFVPAMVKQCEIAYTEAEMFRYSVHKILNTIENYG